MQEVIGSTPIFSTFKKRLHLFVGAFLLLGDFNFECRHSNFIKSNERRLTWREIYPVLKEMLTIGEAAQYMVSKSSFYKMNVNSEIPTYRSDGKRVYLKCSEINNWMTSRRRDSTAEIEQQAVNYIVNSKRTQGGYNKR
jgi:excisionase family DNA binding protein